MTRQNSLHLTMDCQHATLWCWAAVAQCINAFKGKSTTQEQVASNNVGKSCSMDDLEDETVNCDGTSPCAGNCNSPHKLSHVLSDEGHNVQAINIKVLDFEDVVDAVDNGNPLPLRIAITTGSGGGHFLCITGYADDGDGNRFVDVLDPLVPGVRGGAATVRDIPFETLANGKYSVSGDKGKPNFKYELG